MKQLSHYSTYRTGILQARAWRNLRHFMAAALKDYDLSSTEWSLLGVISEEAANGGIRVSDLAKLLDVETSFVTNSLKKLKERGYIAYGYDEDDARVRLIIGTSKCMRDVQKIEQQMRAKMADWLKDVGPIELLQYIAVLEKISSKHE